MILDKYSIVSNTCTGSAIYRLYYPEKHPMLIEYNTPFVASLFLDDSHFFRLCSNYSEYINIGTLTYTPVVEYNTWFEQTLSSKYLHPEVAENYIVSKLGDVEIHWIHDTNFNNLRKKFEGRLESSKKFDTIFVWSVSEMMNLHTDTARKFLIDNFLRLKYKSIFLTNKKEEMFEDENHLSVYIEDWEGKLQTDRKKEGTIAWNDQIAIASIFKDLIDKKFS